MQNTQNAVSPWAKHATEDYQRRGSRYPDGGVPVAISVCHEYANISFKNTSKSAAVRWVANFARLWSLPIKSSRVFQDGDYADDWVEVVIDL